MEHAHMFDIRQPIRKEQQQQQQQQQQQDVCDKCDIYITLEDAYNGIENYVVKIRDQELCVCIPTGVSDKEIIITTTPKVQMVHIIVNIKPHVLFQRNGADLVYEKEISFKESLCGFEFSLKHLNGKTFHLQHKDGTIIKDGVSKTIQRLGMKDGNNGFGSLIIIFKIVYPDKLSKEQIEKLSEIL
jgi:DnaJ-class molecular chaperone